jgi:hypothetical protein
LIELLEIFHGDNTSTIRMSQCLLDIYCAQKESVMKLENARCDKQRWSWMVILLTSVT